MFPVHRTMLITRCVQIFFWYLLLIAQRGHVALAQTDEQQTQSAAEGRPTNALEGQMVLDAFLPEGSFLSAALPFNRANKDDPLQLVSVLKNQDFLDTLLSRLVLPLIKRGEDTALLGTVQEAFQNLAVTGSGLLHRDLLLEALLEKALSPGRFLREKEARDQPGNEQRNYGAGAVGFLSRRRDAQSAASQDVLAARNAVQDFMQLFHKATGGSFDLAAAESAVKDLPPRFCIQLGTLIVEAGSMVLKAVQNAEHPASALVQQIIVPIAGDGVPYIDQKKMRATYGVRPDEEKYSQFNRAPADGLADLLLEVLTEPKALRSHVSTRDSIEARSRIVKSAAEVGKLHRTGDLYANLAGSFADEFLIPAGITTEVAQLIDSALRSSAGVEDKNADVAAEDIVRMAFSLGEVVNSSAFHAAIADAFVSLFLKPLGLVAPVAALLLSKKQVLLKSFAIKALLLQEAVFNNDKLALAFLAPKALVALKLRNGLSKIESASLATKGPPGSEKAGRIQASSSELKTSLVRQAGHDDAKVKTRHNNFVDKLEKSTPAQFNQPSHASTHSVTGNVKDGEEDILESGGSYEIARTPFAEETAKGTPVAVKLLHPLLAGVNDLLSTKPKGENNVIAPEAPAQVVADALTPDEESELNVLFRSVTGGEMFAETEEASSLTEKLEARSEIEAAVREMGSLYGESEEQTELASAFVDHFLVPSGTVTDVADMIRKARKDMSVDAYEKWVGAGPMDYGAPGLHSFLPIAMELEQLVGGKVKAAMMASAFFKLILIPLQLALPVADLLVQNKPRLLTAFAVAALVALAPGADELKKLFLLAVLAPAALNLLRPRDSGGLLSPLKLLIPLLGGLKLLASGGGSGGALAPLAILLPLLGGAALLFSGGNGGGGSLLGGVLTPLKILIPLLGGLKLLASGSGSGGGLSPLALLLPLLAGAALLSSGSQGGGDLMSLGSLLPVLALGLLKAGGKAGLLATGSSFIPLLAGKLAAGELGPKALQLLFSKLGSGGIEDVMIPPMMENMWDNKFMSEEGAEAPAEVVADTLTTDEESELNVLFRSVTGGEMFAETEEASSLTEKLEARSEIEAAVREMGSLYGESEEQTELASAFIDHFLVSSGTVTDVADMIRKARTDMSVDAYEKWVGAGPMDYGAPGLHSFLPIAMELEQLVGGKVKAAMMANAFFKLVLIPLQLALPVANLLIQSKPRLLTAFAVAALVALAPGADELKKLFLLAVLAPAALNLLRPRDSGGLLSPLKLLIPLLGGLKLLSFGKQFGDALAPLAILLPLLGGAALLFSGGNGGGGSLLGGVLTPLKILIPLLGGLKLLASGSGSGGGLSPLALLLPLLAGAALLSSGNQGGGDLMSLGSLLPVLALGLLKAGGKAGLLATGSSFIPLLAGKLAAGELGPKALQLLFSKLGSGGIEDVMIPPMMENMWDNKFMSEEGAEAPAEVVADTLTTDEESELNVLFRSVTGGEMFAETEEASSLTEKLEARSEIEAAVREMGSLYGESEEQTELASAFVDHFLVPSGTVTDVADMIRKARKDMSVDAYEKWVGAGPMEYGAPGLHSFLPIAMELEQLVGGKVKAAMMANAFFKLVLIPLQLALPVANLLIQSKPRLLTAFAVAALVALAPGADELKKLFLLAVLAPAALNLLRPRDSGGLLSPLKLLIPLLGGLKLLSFGKQFGDALAPLAILLPLLGGAALLFSGGNGGGGSLLGGVLTPLKILIPLLGGLKLLASGSRSGGALSPLAILLPLLGGAALLFSGGNGGGGSLLGGVLTPLKILIPLLGGLKLLASSSGSGGGLSPLALLLPLLAGAALLSSGSQGGGDLMSLGSLLPVLALGLLKAGGKAGLLATGSSFIPLLAGKLAAGELGPKALQLLFSKLGSGGIEDVMIPPMMENMWDNKFMSEEGAEAPAEIVADTLTIDEESELNVLFRSVTGGEMFAETEEASSLTEKLEARSEIEAAVREMGSLYGESEEQTELASAFVDHFLVPSGTVTDVADMIRKARKDMSVDAYEKWVGAGPMDYGAPGLHSFLPIAMELEQLVGGKVKAAMMANAFFKLVLIPLQLALPVANLLIQNKPRLLTAFAVAALVALAPGADELKKLFLLAVLAPAALNLLRPRDSGGLLSPLKLLIPLLGGLKLLSFGKQFGDALAPLVILLPLLGGAALLFSGGNGGGGSLLGGVLTPLKILIPLLGGLKLLASGSGSGGALSPLAILLPLLGGAALLFSGGNGGGGSLLGGVLTPLKILIPLLGGLKLLASGSGSGGGLSPLALLLPLLAGAALLSSGNQGGGDLMSLGSLLPVLALGLLKAGGKAGLLATGSSFIPLLAGKLAAGELGPKALQLLFSKLGSGGIEDVMIPPMMENMWDNKFMSEEGAEAPAEVVADTLTTDEESELNVLFRSVTGGEMFAETEEASSLTEKLEARSEIEAAVREMGSLYGESEEQTELASAFVDHFLVPSGTVTDVADMIRKARKDMSVDAYEKWVGAGPMDYGAPGLHSFLPIAMELEQLVGGKVKAAMMANAFFKLVLIPLQLALPVANLLIQSKPRLLTAFAVAALVALAPGADELKKLFLLAVLAPAALNLLRPRDSGGLLSPLKLLIPLLGGLKLLSFGKQFGDALAPLAILLPLLGGAALLFSGGNGGGGSLLGGVLTPLKILIPLLGGLKLLASGSGSGGALSPLAILLPLLGGAALLFSGGNGGGGSLLGGVLTPLKILIPLLGGLKLLASGSGSGGGLSPLALLLPLLAGAALLSSGNQGGGDLMSLGSLLPVLALGLLKAGGKAGLLATGSSFIPLLAGKLAAGELGPKALQLLFSKLGSGGIEDVMIPPMMENMWDNKFMSEEGAEAPAEIVADTLTIDEESELNVLFRSVTGGEMFAETEEASSLTEKLEARSEIEAAVREMGSLYGESEEQTELASAFVDHFLVPSGTVTDVADMIRKARKDMSVDAYEKWVGAGPMDYGAPGLHSFLPIAMELEQLVGGKVKAAMMANAFFKLVLIPLQLALPVANLLIQNKPRLLTAFAVAALVALAPGADELKKLFLLAVLAPAALNLLRPRDSGGLLSPLKLLIPLLGGLKLLSFGKQFGDALAPLAILLPLLGGAALLFSGGNGGGGSLLGGVLTPLKILIPLLGGLKLLASGSGSGGALSPLAILLPLLGGAALLFSGGNGGGGSLLGGVLTPLKILIPLLGGLKLLASGSGSGGGLSPLALLLPLLAGAALLSSGSQGGGDLMSLGSLLPVLALGLLKAGGKAGLLATGSSFIPLLAGKLAAGELGPKALQLLFSKLGSGGIEDVMIPPMMENMWDNKFMSEEGAEAPAEVVADTLTTDEESELNVLFRSVTGGEMFAETEEASSLTEKLEARSEIEAAVREMGSLYGESEEQTELASAFVDHFLVPSGTVTDVADMIRKARKDTSVDAYEKWVGAGPMEYGAPGLHSFLPIAMELEQLVGGKVKAAMMANAFFKLVLIPLQLALPVANLLIQSKPRLLTAFAVAALVALAPGADELKKLFLLAVLAPAALNLLRPRDSGGLLSPLKLLIPLLGGLKLLSFGKQFGDALAPLAILLPLLGGAALLFSGGNGGGGSLLGGVLTPLKILIPLLGGLKLLASGSGSGGALSPLAILLPLLGGAALLFSGGNGGGGSLLGGVLTPLKILIPLLGGLKLLASGSGSGGGLSPLALLLPLLAGAALLSSGNQGGGDLMSLGSLLPVLALGLLKAGGKAGLLATGSSFIPLLAGKLAAGELGPKALQLLFSKLGSGGIEDVMIPPMMENMWDNKFMSEEGAEAPAEVVADTLTTDEESELNVLFRSVTGGEMFAETEEASSLTEKLEARSEIEAAVREMGSLYGESEEQTELASAFVDHFLVPSGTVTDVADMIRKARKDMSVDAYEKWVGAGPMDYGAPGLHSFLPIAMELEQLVGGKVKAAMMANAFFKLVLIPLQLALPVANLLIQNKPRLLTAFAVAALVALAPGADELKKLFLLAVLAPAALNLLRPRDSGGLLSPLKLLIPLLGGLKLLSFGKQFGDALAPLAILLPLLGGAALLFSGGNGGGGSLLGGVLTPLKILIPLLGGLKLLASGSGSGGALSPLAILLPLLGGAALLFSGGNGGGGSLLGGVLTPLKILIPLLGGLKLLASGSGSGGGLSPLALLLPLLAGAALLSSGSQGGGDLMSLGSLLPVLALGLLKAGGKAGLLATGSSFIPLLAGKLAAGELGPKALQLLFSKLGSGGIEDVMIPPMMENMWDNKFMSEEGAEAPAEVVADTLTTDEESELNVLFRSVTGGEMFAETEEASSLTEKLEARSEIEAAVREMGSLYGESEEQTELASAFVDHFLVPSGTVTDVADMIRKARKDMSVDAYEKWVGAGPMEYGAPGLHSFLPIAMELEQLVGGKVKAAMMANAFFKLVLIPLQLALPVANLLIQNKPRLLTAFAVAALVALAPGADELKKLFLLAVLAPAALNLLHPRDSGGLLSPLKLLIPLLGALKLLSAGSGSGGGLSALSLLLPVLGGAGLLFSGGIGGSGLVSGGSSSELALLSPMLGGSNALFGSMLGDLLLPLTFLAPILEGVPLSFSGSPGLGDLASLGSRFSPALDLGSLLAGGSDALTGLLDLLMPLIGDQESPDDLISKVVLLLTSAFGGDIGSLMNGSL